jgi:hypothetical protein
VRMELRVLLYSLAGVTDGTNTYVYLNGEKDGGPSSCGILTDDGNTFTLSHGDSRYTWVGSIGELAVYNRALTALDIRNHREATKWRYK